MVCVIVHEVKSTLMLVDRFVIALAPKEVIAKLVALKIEMKFVLHFYSIQKIATKGQFYCK